MKVCKRIAAVLALLIAILACTPLYTSAADVERVAIPGSGWDDLGNRSPTGMPHHWNRLGQRLTIPGQRIVSIGYMVCKVGNPTGDVILSIRDSQTDEVIASKVWGDASQLPERSVASGKYIEVEFIRPVWVRGDVRISVEYYDGDLDNHALAAYWKGDRIPGQWYTNHFNYNYWHDIGEAEEGSYMYTYLVGDAKPPKVNGAGGEGDAPRTLIFVVAGVALAACVVLLKARRAE